jgi:hypothetical protein
LDEGARHDPTAAVTGAVRGLAAPSRLTVKQAAERHRALAKHLAECKGSQTPDNRYMWSVSRQRLDGLGPK